MTTATQPTPAPTWLKLPRVGGKVRVMIDRGGYADDETTWVLVPAGEIWEVDRIDYFGRSQQVAYTLVHPSGVFTVIDETDAIGGYYPLELVDES